MNLRPLRLMTGEADVGLGQLVQYRVVLRVDQVTGRASDVAPFVLASGPVRTQPSLVAAQAGAGLGFGRRVGVRAKVDVDQRPGLRALRIFHVSLTGTVAALAAGCARIGFDAVPSLVDREDGIGLGLVVTARADRVPR